MQRSPELQPTPFRHLSKRWLVLAFVLLGAVSAGRAVPALADANSVALWKIYAPGWNLVAGPAGSHLGLHDETLYTLNGAVPAYQSPSQARARAGEGYWVFYPQGAMLLLIGTPQNVSSVHVDAGNWAILGNSGTMRAAVRGADIALTYEPDAGFAPASWIQPGQAVLVYAYSDADVFLDPYAQPSTTSLTPRQPPQAAPALPAPAQPNAQGVTTSTVSVPANTPTDELNYLFALDPILTDVDQQLSHFADNIGLADTSRPNDPTWDALRADSAQVQHDLTLLQTLTPPARYTQVQADLEAAISDIGDGMSDTVAGLLNGQPDRVTLGSGLLEAGARRLTTARQRLPQ